MYALCTYFLHDQNFSQQVQQSNEYLATCVYEHNGAEISTVYKNCCFSKPLCNVSYVKMIFLYGKK